MPKRTPRYGELALAHVPPDAPLRDVHAVLRQLLAELDLHRQRVTRLNVAIEEVGQLLAKPHEMPFNHRSN